MDFIKKHFEKILLAGTLVLLIGVAGFLAYRVSGLSEEVQAGPKGPKVKGKPIPGLDTSEYTNAIKVLQTPSLWHTNTVDPFQTQVVAPPQEITQPVVRVTGPQVQLIRIIRQPFKLKFQSYKEPGEDFAVNFLTRNRTFFVHKVGMEIADSFERTGYFITKFDKKTTNIFNRGIGVTNTVDISELTIEKPGNQPLVLVRDKVAQEREPIGVLFCQTDNQETRIRKGDPYTCGAKTYKVIDITLTQVIIEDTQSKEKTTISLPGAKE